MEILHGQYEYLQGGVLILIIMEDTHGVEYDQPFKYWVISLNPYYNGRYSWRHSIYLI